MKMVFALWGSEKMDDLISRQDAIDVIRFECGEWTGLAKTIENKISALPSAQPEIEERMSETEHFVPNDDFISRKWAIDAIEAVFPVDPMKSEYAQGIACGAALSKTYIEQLPSAQPEIIHCCDCKHRGEKPIADGRYWCEIHDTFMYYCSDAERRTDD